MSANFRPNGVMTQKDSIALGRRRVGLVAAQFAANHRLCQPLWKAACITGEISTEIHDEMRRTLRFSRWSGFKSFWRLFSGCVGVTCLTESDHLREWNSAIVRSCIIHLA